MTHLIEAFFQDLKGIDWESIESSNVDLILLVIDVFVLSSFCRTQFGVLLVCLFLLLSPIELAIWIFCMNVLENLMHANGHCFELTRAPCNSSLIVTQLQSMNKHF